MQNTAKQLLLAGMCPLDAAVQELATGSEDDRGAIFTRAEVVDFMLDLIGYTSRKKLFSKRLLEPSFGHGDFLMPSVDRLLLSWKRDGEDPSQLKDAIRAVELHQASFEHTRTLVLERLEDAGVNRKQAVSITSSWLHNSDFLLWDSEPDFNFVVGNPPYIRIERIPDALMKEYRRRYKTMFDRADLYIPFIEHSLALLAPKGQLGFICADRWMKNKYGGPLRSFIEKDFHLKIHVDMVGTPAFHSDVIAYPAITVISKEKSGVTRVAERPDISSKSLAKLSRKLTSSKNLSGPSSSGVQPIKNFTNGSAPWLLSNCKALELVRKLERQFPLLEEAGCKVGIGVATGADKAYIGPLKELNVEPSRKLPLATTRDIQSGKVNWGGLGIINPFEKDGKLVDLAKYPKLRSYFEQWEEVLKNRHVAKKTPLRWYRTIDRIHHDLTKQEKLLVPDIKGNANFVFEPGKLYPHHNLYFITSNDWDLKALQVVLCSGLAQLFVSLYSPRMRGDYLRFQAQHLRRICIPRWSDVPKSLKAKLGAAWEAGDYAEYPSLVAELFELTEMERETMISVPKQGVHANAN